MKTYLTLKEVKCKSSKLRKQILMILDTCSNMCTCFLSKNSVSCQTGIGFSLETVWHISSDVSQTTSSCFHSIRMAAVFLSRTSSGSARKSCLFTSNIATWPALCTSSTCVCDQPMIRYKAYRYISSFPNPPVSDIHRQMASTKWYTWTLAARLIESGFSMRTSGELNLICWASSTGRWSW